MDAGHRSDRFFPLLAVHDHEGAAGETPEVFSGRSNVVVVVPDPAHHEHATTWHDWLDRRTRAHEGFQWYELVAPDHPEVTGPQTLSRLRLVDGPAHLVESLDLPQDHVAVLSVSHEGLVHHVEHGPYSDDAARRLSDALMAGA